MERCRSRSGPTNGSSSSKHRRRARARRAVCGEIQPIAKQRRHARANRPRRCNRKVPPAGPSCVEVPLQLFELDAPAAEDVAQGHVRHDHEQQSSTQPGDGVPHAEHEAVDRTREARLGQRVRARTRRGRQCVRFISRIGELAPVPHTRAGERALRGQYASRSRRPPLASSGEYLVGDATRARPRSRRAALQGLYARWRRTPSSTAPCRASARARLRVTPAVQAGLDQRLRPAGIETLPRPTRSPRPGARP